MEDVPCIAPILAPDKGKEPYQTLTPMTCSP
jgi:hypothetical protein